jgi:hypothetical protein
MVNDEAALRKAADGREQAGDDDKIELLGRRILSETGNEVGTVADVIFDPATGAVELVDAGQLKMPAGTILGAGYYALVVAANQDRA